MFKRILQVLGIFLVLVIVIPFISPLTDTRPSQHKFSGRLNDRLVPKADPKISYFLLVKTSALEKSGHSGISPRFSQS
jgi:hypothetical protein